jgi:hypothetical protein
MSNLPISQYTGATFKTVPAHMTELMANIMLEMKSQAIMERVPMFLALQCDGRGMRTRAAAINALMGSPICMVLGKELSCGRPLAQAL